MYRGDSIIERRIYYFSFYNRKDLLRFIELGVGKGFYILGRR